MTISVRACVLALGGGLWLGGCSQADPSAMAQSADGTSGDPGDSDSHYPLVDGASWSYLHTLADGTQWTEDVEMRSMTFDGGDAFEVVDSADPKGNHTESILVAMDGTTLRVHKEEFVGSTRLVIVDYAPGFPRFDASWLESSVGDVDDRSYVRTETDGAGQSPTVEDREQRYTIEELDVAVTVPAGDFAGCVVVRRDRLVGGPALVERTWFCPGVGQVKELNATSGNREELSAFAGLE